MTIDPAARRTPASAVCGALRTGSGMLVPVAAPVDWPFAPEVSAAIDPLLRELMTTRLSIQEVYAHLRDALGSHGVSVPEDELHRWVHAAALATA